MFTGIIKDLGLIEAINDSRYVIKAEASLLEQLTIGASVAVNGVCLTVEELTSANSFTVTVMPETLRVTNLGELKPGDGVNLELPVGVNSLLDGHIVQGHVDGVAKLTAIKPLKDSHLLEFSVDEQLLKYFVAKGSVTINGISLTLVDVRGDGFSVSIIPHSWQQTNLHELEVGDTVNLEVDVIAKYVYKFTRLGKGD